MLALGVAGHAYMGGDGWAGRKSVEPCSATTGRWFRNRVRCCCCIGTRPRPSDSDLRVDRLFSASQIFEFAVSSSTPRGRRARTVLDNYNDIAWFLKHTPAAAPSLNLF